MRSQIQSASNHKADSSDTTRLGKYALSVVYSRIFREVSLKPLLDLCSERCKCQASKELRQV